MNKKNIISFDENFKRHGYCESYWGNGEISERGYWIHGRVYGFWEKYHRNGNIETRYKGFKNFRIEYLENYLENGVLHSKGYKFNGKVHHFHYYDILNEDKCANYFLFGKTILNDPYITSKNKIIL